MKEFGDNPGQNPERRDWRDSPDFNFEFPRIEHNLRTDEFCTEIQRLAVDWDEEDEFPEPPASRYELPDGSTVDVYHEHDEESGDSQSVVIRRAPAIETVHDGQKRRATCCRAYTFSHNPESDLEDSDISDDLEEEDKKVGPQQPTPEWVVRNVEKRAFQMSMGEIEPTEVISVNTFTKIEVKLPNNPAYRTEHPATLKSENLKAHNEMVSAAVAQSGFSTNKKYSPQEHSELMGILQSIDPSQIQPIEINFEF